MDPMARFDDYHRTVVGYHGTGLTAALRIVNRIEDLRLSERDYDWLERGIYFCLLRGGIEAANALLPENNRKDRKLDRAVFEYTYKLIEDSEPNLKVDTSRGVYIPTDYAKRLWEGSWISRDTHIQLCVRNSASILGTWLHYPPDLEVNDVCEALQVDVTGVEPENPQGEGQAQADAEGEAD
jgi:hypothetical protein